MTRPAVDVVVPFKGRREELESLGSRLGRLRRDPHDTLTIVDNTPEALNSEALGFDEIQVVAARERSTPGFARNAGAACGSAQWLIFIDADTQPSPDLLERYFDPPPGERTALLAGGVRDEAVPPDGPAAPRYAYLKEAMSQRQTFRLEEWGFSQTANAACRRAAFEEIGGFCDHVRAGEDADLCYRLRRRGWMIERREQAFVVHRNRRSIHAFAAQKALHGAGAAWLNRTYPGSFPPRRVPGLLWWAARHTAGGLAASLRARDRDQALLAWLDPLEQLSFELGRALPNERPIRRSRPGRRRPTSPT